MRPARHPSNNQPKRPKWLRLAEELNPLLIRHALAAIESRRQENLQHAVMTEAALAHFTSCLETSSVVNRQGHHSVALCLARQCVETLTVVDIGFQPAAFSTPLLARWDKGDATQGQLRAALEAGPWSSYGTGLWDETWAIFFASLAKAVQPYAHYTSALFQWQLAVRGYDGGNQFIAYMAPGAYDAIKASRITLLHVLVVWALGRILAANLADDRFPSYLRGRLREMGEALASSKLLFQKDSWPEQLWPHVFFEPGADWVDDE